MFKSPILKYLLVILSLLWYYLLYYQIVREEFLYLIFGIAILGVIYLYWINNEFFTKKEIIGIAILFRLVLLFDTPNFSDDCYRFVWDGNLVAQGVNPYENTPRQLMLQKENYSSSLPTIFEDLNSPDYFTVYPPVNQFLFGAANFLSGENTLLPIFYMKIFILLFEIGLIFLLFQFLKKLKLKESLAQIYALNPLVIIELTGNVHFEGVMLFFMLAGCWFLMKNKMLMAGVLFALAINTKVIPLLFLPLLLPLLGIKKAVKFFGAIGLTSALLVLPFLSDVLIHNFSQSLNLYFQSFEFNASIYYLLKGVSYVFLGYKSSLIGTVVPLVVFAVAMALMIRLFLKKSNKNLSQFDFLLFVNYAIPLLFFYYLLASTIHPWYVINLLVLAVFIKRVSIIIWTLLAFLSYFAYSNSIIDGDFHDSSLYYILVSFEYLIVIGLFIFEQLKFKKNES